MEKIWLNQYPEGVPQTLEIDPKESLADLIAEACNTFSGQIAYSNMGQTLTYRQLDELSLRFAAYLRTDLGLQKGDRVAIMMPNLLQYPVALFGVLRAGLVVVNVNPLYTGRELEYQLDDSGARVIVISSMSAHTLAEVIEGTLIEKAIVTDVGDLMSWPKRAVVNFVVRYVKRLVPAYELPKQISFLDALETDPGSLPMVELSGQDLAVLQYTGGTTGRAKGAMLSHGNLVANVHQINAWFSMVVEEGAELVVTALPLYHVYAMTCNCLCYLKLGAHNLLITDPRDTAGFIRELKRHRFTAITGVNTLYQSLVNHPDFAEVDFSSLNVASAGGMAVLDDTARRWHEITGVVVTEGYGLSETSPVVTSNPIGSGEFRGSIGLPLPGTEVVLRDDDGREAPVGEPAELCVRGPQVMQGYWENQEATAETMTEDGFLKTGDIAVVDEQGFFTIVDRKKDMIIVSGFNVYPNEVENIVTLHPDVVEAACVGATDERGGEVVKVFVVLKAGAKTTVDDIRTHCREELAAYKVPKLVEFRDALPKSAVGKILRRELRQK
ncbi:MAG: AMP-binding protein [Gammaproteobacteria bacterium]|nr:AMP-binding protein [Gammaproteobacteria bacterium]